jgi:hypothetical protein
MAGITATTPIIVRRAAGRRVHGAGSSTHVDGNVVDMDATSVADLEALACSEVSVDKADISELRDAFVVAMNGHRPNMREVICFCCFGAGHIRNDCPSKQQDTRTVHSMIALLTALASRKLQRSQQPSDELPTTGNPSAPIPTPIRQKVPGCWRTPPPPRAR